MARAIFSGKLRFKLILNKKKTPVGNGCVAYGCCIFCTGAVAYLLRARATFTAQATVQPTMGLLPIPKKPIISTCAGTDEEPAN